MKSEKGILVAFLLNLFFSIFELFGGLFTNSIAIMSDAIHDFGDALSIGFSYFMEKKSKGKPDEKHTYGYGRYSVLGATVTAVILLLGSMYVIYNSLVRLVFPEPINYNGMIIFAVIGVVVNIIATIVTRDGESLNQKVVNLHMLEDVLGWVIVLIGSIVMKFTDISIIDSVLSIGVAIFIYMNALKSMGSISNTFMEKVPKDIKIEEIKEHLLGINGVKDVHHIHIWTLNGGNANCATMHAVIDGDSKSIKEEIREELLEHNIPHVTIETETVEEHCCEEECSINDINESRHSHHNH